MLIGGWVNLYDVKKLNRNIILDVRGKLKQKKVFNKIKKQTTNFSFHKNRSLNFGYSFVANCGRWGEIKNGDFSHSFLKWGGGGHFKMFSGQPGYIR